MLVGIVYQLGRGGEAHLLEDVVLVGLDGTRAEAQLVGNLLCRQAFGAQSDDLHLALGEVGFLPPQRSW